MLFHRSSSLTAVGFCCAKVTSRSPFGTTPIVDDAPFFQKLEQRALVSYGENKVEVIYDSSKFGDLARVLRICKVRRPTSRIASPLLETNIVPSEVKYPPRGSRFHEFGYRSVSEVCRGIAGLGAVLSPVGHCAAVFIGRSKTLPRRDIARDRDRSKLNWNRYQRLHTTLF